MTKEEAINHIKYGVIENNYPLPKELGIEVFDMAIKALEQEVKMRDATPEERESVNKYIKSISTTGVEHSEDCVSRQSMLDAITEIDDNTNMDIYTNEVREIIKDLPPVTPKGVTVTDFADKCRECGKQKKGKWIYHEKSISTGFKDLRECSCCKCYFDWLMPRNSYCPNCGAEMEDEE